MKRLYKTMTCSKKISCILYYFRSFSFVLLPKLSLLFIFSNIIIFYQIIVIFIPLVAILSVVFLVPVIFALFSIVIKNFILFFFHLLLVFLNTNIVYCVILSFKFGCFNVADILFLDCSLF